MTDIRIGQGYDVHRLSEGYPLMIGGIEVPHHVGSEGHSDADVLIHAICDALLGAAALGDIGTHFPDTDPAYKGIDSKKLLKQVVELLQEAGYAIGNIDATVCLQRPKIKPYIPTMRECLAQVMGVHVSQVSIKATTTEKLGFVGREEGISALAIALIYKNQA
ncbi:2-C-methyl-D-erythritol 2,4-cyclodiphosphate synthase [Thermonema rossianum]|uniref:2-C-methyl-D-erythritol 2,4-cyclodiphosphate synthase n=1 Tax=Thermonema rossianum TaxID=55505 RepID=UPI00056EA752|nr:2-C-methyl-D-erythritol 2,4-cyclodiphosphate synthase [Thermonema rossianum]